jgi:hypothetical protein
MSTPRDKVTLLDAIDDRNLFARWFRNPSTWASWFVFLRALFGLPLTPSQLFLYRECTGRSEPPTSPATEGWLICGRRSGKSFMLALIAVYLACFKDHRHLLAPGERGTILIVSPDRKQSRVILRFIKALLTKVPMLARMIEREVAEGFDLTNSVTIEVGTASHRSVRGYAILAGLLDEAAFFPHDDAAEPDYEIINALRPGMATIPNSLLLVASSPYAQRGSLYDAYKQHFAKDHDPVLVWRAPTRTMNPTVPQGIVDKAMSRDPAFAAAEYMAQFRADIEAFITRAAVEAAVIPGRFELPRVDRTRYTGFVDPSGGSSDSMTLGICHSRSGIMVTDCIRERRPPFSPDAVVKEFADTLKSYGITRVHGDRYGGEWPREVFRKHGIEYKVADKTKSEIYLALLPLLNSQRVELLDHQRLVSQLCSLERRTSRAGKDSVDHVPGSFDDVANAVAGCIVIAHALAARPPIKIVSLTLFSTRDGSVIIGPQPTLGPHASPREIASSPCQPPAPIGGFRPSSMEPWYGFSGRARARWPGS